MGIECFTMSVLIFDPCFKVQKGQLIKSSSVSHILGSKGIRIVIKLLDILGFESFARADLTFHSSFKVKQSGLPMRAFFLP